MSRHRLYHRVIFSILAIYSQNIKNSFHFISFPFGELTDHHFKKQNYLLKYLNSTVAQFQCQLHAHHFVWILFYVVMRKICIQFDKVI